MRFSQTISATFRNPLIGLQLGFWFTGLVSVSVAQSPSSATAARSTIARNYGVLPLSFEENQGQAGQQVRYLARGAGYSIQLDDSEAQLLLSRPIHPDENPNLLTRSDLKAQQLSSALPDILHMRLIGRDVRVAMSPESQLPGTVNYFIGNDPAKWHIAIPTFERVKYTGVYHGIDLTYYGNQDRLEFDFDVAPGADPQKVRFQLGGARRLKIDAQGDLVVTVGTSSVTYHKPVIYQSVADGSRELIPGSFVLLARNVVRFEVGSYDHSRSLIIDPILTYSTYFGSGSSVAAIAVDAAGEAFITGNAAVVLTTPDSYQTQSPTKTYPLGNYPPYVAKFNSTGTALVYCTYLSGTGTDQTFALAIDSKGDAYVGGMTTSADFPVTPGAFQAVNKTAGTQSQGTGFVTELNSAGSALVYSTFLGGSTNNLVWAAAVDSNGAAFVTGTTYDEDFPTTSGAFQSAPPGKTSTMGSGFVTKLNSSGSSLAYSTYLSGSSEDYATGVAIDLSGDAYVAGETTSSNFPVTRGAAQTSFFGGLEGFLTKLNPSGSAPVYSTYLGENGQIGVANVLTGVGGVAVDSAGEAFVAGASDSVEFVTKLNSTGTALVYSQDYPNSYEAEVNAIALDSDGDAIVAGCTGSTDYPVTTGAFQTENLAALYSDNYGGFVTKINPTGSAFLYSTYLSGTGDQTGEDLDCVEAMAVDSAGNVYVAGNATSADFPTVPSAFQSELGRAFVTELNASEMTTLPPTTLNISPSYPTVEFGQSVTFTATVQTISGQTPTGSVGFSFLGVEGSDDSGVGFGPWGWVPLDSSGVASLTLDTNTLSVDKIEFNAQYLGDANNAPSYASSAETLTQIPTTTTLTSSQNPAIYGAPVVFTATILENTGKPAKGIVFFICGVTYAQVGLDANGQASWTNGTGGPPLSIGTDTVTAQFFATLGDAQSSGTLTESFTPLGTTPAPTFSPPAGTYSSPQTVTINDSNPLASIYYTTDGTTPVVNNSDIFPTGGTIPLSSSETVQTIAVAPGYTVSQVASATYSINIPAPDFTISVSPSTMTLSPGYPGSTTVSVGSISGFAQSVTLSSAGCPAGATCTFTASTVVPGTNSQLTIVAPTIASAARQALMIRFASGTTLAFGLYWVGVKRRKMKGWIALLCLISLSAIYGCGGGSTGAGGGGGGGSSSTYAITINGVAGTNSHSATLTLTVN